MTTLAASTTELDLHHGPLPPERLAIDSLVVPEHGALASFVGIVRNEHHGRAVTHLHYECQEALARNVLADLAASLRQQFGSELAIRIVHALGTLHPRDAAIVIHIAAPHRRAALEACDEAIEAIKRDLPVWKHEHYADGESAWLPGS